MITRSFRMSMDADRKPTRYWIVGRDGTWRPVYSMGSVYDSLLKGQESLGAEFEAIWDANVDALYEA